VKIRIRKPKFKPTQIASDLRDSAEKLMRRVESMAAKQFKRRADEDVDQLVDERLGFIAETDEAKALEFHKKLQSGELSKGDFLGVKLPKIETREDKARALKAGFRQSPWKEPEVGEAGPIGLRDVVNEAQRIMGRSKSMTELVGIENKARREQQAELVAGEVVDSDVKPLRATKSGDPRGAGAIRAAKILKSSLQSLAVAITGGNTSTVAVDVFGRQTMAKSSEQKNIESEYRILLESFLKELGVSRRDKLEIQRAPNVQKLSNGQEIAWTGAERITMYAMMQDAEARENILHNGMRLARRKSQRETTIKGEGETPLARYLNMGSLVNEIADGMTEQERQIATEMVKNLTSMGPLANEVTRRINAKDLFLSTSYFPMSGAVDRSRVKKWETVDPVLGAQMGEGMTKMVDQWGSSKERVPHRNTILIGDGFNIYDRHVREMSIFIAYSELQRDVLNILDDEDVEGAIVARWGIRMIPEMKMYYENLAHQEAERDRWKVFQRGANFVQRNFSTQLLGFRLSSIGLNRVGGSMLNMAWLLGNMPKVAPAYAKRSANPVRLPFKLLTKDSKEIRDELLKKGYFEDRWVSDPHRVYGQTPREREDARLAGANEALEIGKLRYRQLKQKGMSGMGWAEMRNVIELVQALEDTGNSRAAAIQIAEVVTRDTQNPSTELEETVGYRKLRKSGFGVFFPFMGQPSVVADYVARQLNIARHESKTNKTAAAKRRGAVAIGAVMAALYAVLQRAIFRAASKGILDDDEEEIIEKEGMNLVTDSLQELADIGVPGASRIVGPAIAMGEAALTGKRAPLRNLERPGSILGRMSVNFVRAYKELLEWNETKDVDQDELERIIISLNNSLVSFTGAPTGGLEQLEKVRRGVFTERPLGRSGKKKKKKKGGIRRSSIRRR